MTTRSPYAGLRNAMRGTVLTLLMVAITTVVIAPLQWETGLTHGASIYLIPVVVAAMRWGIVPAVVASDPNAPRILITELGVGYRLAQEAGTAALGGATVRA